MSAWVHERPQTLTPAQVEDLWRFLGRFSFRPRDSFEHALASLERVSTLRDAQGALQGLVGTRFVEGCVEGRRAGVLFVHWAVLDAAQRGQHALFWLLLGDLLARGLRQPGRCHYVMFGATTFKSYLAATRKGIPIWPSRSTPWPAWERALVEAIMAELGDSNWKPALGVVRRDGEIGFYEGRLPQEDIADPDLRYYLEANPGHNKGDMLICLVPVTFEAFGRAIANLLGRRLRPHRSTR